ncbi:MAG: acyl-CoA thioesterase [Ignavibacteriales bacterium]|nr:MAG: acyl-CoA thioesterase [Ignavibacteriaceae bacterium]MBW7874228.1 acyl-CoA thioesterase [Ignavibacteria bacterium]MCZ2142300.1 acyl-CoA thioesterase [Ignavibacteriales bacterium]OQY76430.1 MAG: hypothetical protein B6D45_03465 [Ignavibacteriales bacterium UTCHB3]MBV6445184.1 1,4-dihydroxy-2-naphthoyl-CoA hydrolase [Ignavibacteriaceae bacterium]
MFLVEKYISFGDCDPAGVIFFSRVFDIAHTVYEKFLFDNNLGDYFANREVLIPLVHAEADYKKPLRTGDIVNAVVRLAELKECSFKLSYSIFDKSGKVAVTIKTVHTTVTKAEFKKCPVPEDLKTALLKIRD